MITARPRSNYLAAALAIIASALPLLSGCADATAAAPPAVALRVGLPGARGVSLGFQSAAPLVAQPVAADSTPVGTPVRATWTSSDTSIVSVDLTGTIMSRQRAGAVVIQARARVGGRDLTGQTTIHVL